MGDSYPRKLNVGGPNGMVVEFARQDVEWIDGGGAWGLSPDTEHFPRIACASTQNAFTSLSLVSDAYELIPQGNRLQLLSGNSNIFALRHRTATFKRALLTALALILGAPLAPDNVLSME